jgi:hypothetical protein
MVKEARPEKTRQLRQNKEKKITVKSEKLSKNGDKYLFFPEDSEAFAAVSQNAGEGNRELRGT